MLTMIWFLTRSDFDLFPTFSGKPRSPTVPPSQKPTKYNQIHRYTAPQTAWCRWVQEWIDFHNEDIKIISFSIRKWPRIGGQSSMFSSKKPKFWFISPYIPTKGLSAPHCGSRSSIFIAPGRSQQWSPDSPPRVRARWHHHHRHQSTAGCLASYLPRSQDS